MTATDIRWKQRFANFRKALSKLRKFIDKGDLSELEQQGLIKAFEYTFELAWNSLKDFPETRARAKSSAHGTPSARPLPLAWWKTAKAGWTC